MKLKQITIAVDDRGEPLHFTKGGVGKQYLFPDWITERFVVKYLKWIEILFDIIPAENLFKVVRNERQFIKVLVLFKNKEFLTAMNLLIQKPNRNDFTQQLYETIVLWLKTSTDKNPPLSPKQIQAILTKTDFEKTQIWTNRAKY